MISKAQRELLMIHLWPPAAKALGIKTSDRQARLDYLSKIVGRPLESANDLSNTKSDDEFGKVKDALLMLVANLDAAMRDTKPNERKAENKRWFIRNEQLRCLALYCDAPSSAVAASFSSRPEEPVGAQTQAEACGYSSEGMAGAKRLLASIIQDKFHHASRVDALTLDDLDDSPRVVTNRRTGKLMELPSQLGQIVMTLGRLIQQRRKAAGDTLHDMRTRAGLKCECRECSIKWRQDSGVRIQRPKPEPAYVGGRDENEPF